MVMRATQPRRWTADEVRALPDQPGTRYECVDGELLVSPGPRLVHQYVAGELHLWLTGFCQQHGIGVAVMAPGEMELDPHTLVQPDNYVLPLIDGRRPREAHEIGHALLFIEVLSPSSARTDRIIKRHRYQRYGVEYWIVDPEARAVERWWPHAAEAEVLSDTIDWAPRGTPEPLTINLRELFSDALDR
jgi:Uma2 family endonuclease